MGYENTEKSAGWQGNWAAGERPEGYVKTTERYRSLRNQGYRASVDLGEKFIEEYRALIKKAQEEGLSGIELSKLLEKNNFFIKAMEDYEKTL